MQVILARLRLTSAAPAVHAWHTHDFDPSASSSPQLVSACGLAADRTDIEPVNAITGAPCTPCLLLSCAAEPGTPGAFPEKSPPMHTVDSTVDNPHHYGVALRGERHIHFVEPNAMRGYLDGREVAQTLCRSLAWGPFTAPPNDWPTCAECTEITRPIPEVHHLLHPR